MHHQQSFSTTFALSISEQIVDSTARKTKEAWYINQFKTKIPFGFNVIHNSNSTSGPAEIDDVSLYKALPRLPHSQFRLCS